MNSCFFKQKKCCRRLYPAFPPAVPPIPEPQGPLTVMTWNIYLGADLTPIFTATPAELRQAVTEVFRQFLATNFPVRVEAIARQIVLKKPDIIGLQEAEIWQLFIPGLPTVTYDFVELLLDELRTFGLHYEVAAQNDNNSVQLPSSNGNIIGLLDRDVILIRKNSGLNIIQRQNANYEAKLTIPIGGQPLTIVHGWSFIDVSANGRIFRVINTHLEPLSPPVQVAQGNELLAGPANTNLPLILLGDLNSNAAGTGTPTYGNLINAGFQDVWTEVGKGQGFTCCQNPDLLNAVSSLNRRIDFILFKNGWNPIVADVVGEEQHDRTSTGLWPSDHAGVFASLDL
ncbi:endonuclease/exonuclease/phosphatase family protein [Bacillus luti]|uniref:endonuclease/exonuclease/phosphatase family protein n=1 Tax=Bacillus luti TaxID=2026191 RepID=UPI000B1A3738|nr:endonuclease/exonuclease/phosphatase family protein [Bacillus luti]